MRKMKDSGIHWIGQIPEDWEAIPIKYLASYNDDVLSETTDPDYEFEYIEIGSVEYGKGITQTEKLKFEKAPSRARRVVKKDDVIISTVRTYLRAIATIGDSSIQQVVSTGFIVIRAKNILPSFLKHAVLSEPFICKVESHSNGISYPAINSSEIVKFKVPLPPLAEQQAIANFLDQKCSAIDSVLEKTRASIEEYKKLKQSVITQAVTKGIRPNRQMKDISNKWFGLIPSDWETKKIKFVFTIKKEIAGKEGYTVLSITQKGIIPKDLSKNEGQLAENYSNYQLVNIGNFAMNHMDLLTGGVDISKYNGVTSPDYRVFILNDKVTNNDRYFLYLMRMCYSNKIFYGLGAGVSGMGRWRLQADKFLNFIIPIPPKDEQLAIADYLDAKCTEIDNLIAKKEQFLTEIEAYKKSLIYEYVTGKKEVARC